MAEKYGYDAVRKAADAFSPSMFGRKRLVAFEETCSFFSKQAEGGQEL